jgi:trk/ktr system potassium uptake protein
MNVLIAGAGNVGRYLAHILVGAGHEVTLIDRDGAALERARVESGARCVHGDASEPSLLEQSGARAMDVVVAATGDDEDNLVVASLAKSEFAAPRVVARVKNAANSWLYQPDLGVDVLVSAPHTIAQLIEEKVAVGDVVQLLELAEGQAALLEATLPPGCPVVGSRVGEVAWPADCVVVAVIRGSRVLSAPAETLLEAGDRLLCLTDTSQIDPLHDLLGTAPSQGS